ncbi:MAG: DUF362 domain-containing protein, partial [Rikenellaceae bacterium]|nr:DUF362 domain-containing protein [Rikenellaceae bacterium]
GEPVAMLNRMLTEMGGMAKFVKKGQKVVIKPNIGFDKGPQTGSNTNPQLIGALVKQCKDAGASEILVFDHTLNDWRNCYQNSGIEKEVVDNGGKMVPGNDESFYVDVQLPRGVKLKNTKIHRDLIDCDVWFNVPALKNHGGAKMTAAMKNYLGIVWDRRIFHSNDLQQCIADINTWSKKPALHIVDAYRVVKTNGPGGKTPEDVTVAKALFASADPVAVDTAAAKFFIQMRPDISLADIAHIKNGENLKLGTMDIDKVKVSRISMA